MHQALYRMWRPKSFDDVVGQEHITETLKNEIRAGRPSHAYLLMGSRGTGKTTCAKLIAKAVNCLDPRDGSPCGVCEICRGIDSGSILDVVEIDAATNTGVDSIRDLREEAMFLPNTARYRVYIMDEAHMLSAGAIGALLKIIEEPPEHVIFILATTEAHKIPATLQSRCQRFDFRRIDSEVIAGRLLYVAQQEGLRLSPDAAAMLARLAEGGMRDALSLLDLCAAQGEEITPQLVVRVTGMAAQDYLFDFADAAAEQNTGRALSLLDTASASVEQDRLCVQLITHFRNLMAARVSKNPEKLIVCMPETLRKYREQAGRFSLEALLYAIGILQEAQNAMTRTQSRRVLLETAAARICDPSLCDSPQALLARIAALERALQTPAENAARAAVSEKAPRGTHATAVQAEKPPEKAGTGPADGAPCDAPDKSRNGTGAGTPVSTRGAAQTETIPREDAAAEKIPAGADKPRRAEPAREKAETGPADGAPNDLPFAEWEQVLRRLQTANPGLAAALAGTEAFLSGGRVLISCGNPVFTDMMRSNEYTRATLKDAIADVTGRRYAIGPYDRPADPDVPAHSPLDDIIADAMAAGIEVRYD